MNTVHPNPSADSQRVIGQIDRGTAATNHRIYPGINSEISRTPTEDSGCDRGLELGSPRFPSSARTATAGRKKLSGATKNMSHRFVPTGCSAVIQIDWLIR